MKKNYIFLADGFEEIEAITVIDMLRRANIDITTVSVTNHLEVTGAHNIVVKADKTITDYKFERIGYLILPGGGNGVKNLGKCMPLIDLLKNHYINKGKIAAICAAPAILGGMGMLDNIKATCYPGFENFLSKSLYTADRLEITDQIITANGPSSASLFATAIIAQITDKENAIQVLNGMLQDIPAWLETM